MIYFCKDFVNGLQEQIRLKSERLRQEKEQDAQYSVPQEHPTSSQSRRNCNYQYDDTSPNSNQPPKPRSRGKN